jgi:hypothetical protein
MMMKNKKIFALAFLALLVVATLPATLAADRPSLDMSLLSYTPVPARPGDYVTVTFKLTNNGAASTTNAVVEFIDNYPFSLDNEPTRVENVGVLPSQQSYLVEYRVRIDPAALEGTNKLKLRFVVDKDTSNWVEKEFSLTVSSAQKTVSINSVSTNPKTITPGGEVELDLKLKNLASGDLRDVGIRLDLEGVVVGTTYVDIPLAPIGSSIEKKLSLLKSGETIDFLFTLQAYPDADAGIYKVPVTLTYVDDLGTEYERQDLISLVINSEPDVLLLVDETNLYSDNARGDVTFSITNKGLADIKFLTVGLAESDAYTVLSNDEVYVGGVDSDDYETADFTLRLNEGLKDMVTLPVTLTFKDALNNEHIITKDVSLNLLSSSDANGAKKSKAGTIIAVLVILGVIIFFWRRAKKCKAKKKK